MSRVERGLSGPLLLNDLGERLQSVYLFVKVSTMTLKRYLVVLVWALDCFDKV